MRLKPLLLTTLMGTILMSAPATLMAKESSLKVAVIKDTTDSKNIINGEYKKTIANLSTTSNSLNFEESTSLCVAYLKANDKINAESACTAAITSSKHISSRNDNVNYLQSVSFNNRAVARYLKNDYTGAMNDLASARAIHNNKLVKSNITLMNSKIELIDDSQTSSFAE